MISALGAIAESRGLDAVIIVAPDNVEYFTGIPTIGDATLMLIYEKKDNHFSLYVPLLEYYRYRHSAPSTIDVIGVSRALKPPDIPVVELDWGEILAKYKGLGKIGVDASHTSSLQVTVQRVLGDQVVDVSRDVWRVRMIKSAEEVKSIEVATRITLRGILAVCSGLREDITETSLTGVFEKAVRDQGAERLAFDPIIAFKPTNSYPHALPGTRKLGKRNLVLVDVGVKYRGRCSDVTRMVLWGKPRGDERKSVEAVVEALEAAVDSIKPGVKANEVYEVAAKVLEKHGLREKFIHGLGHGVGVVVHEPPYLRRGEEIVLEPGMVFTVEPGVYFAGDYGVRVEEVVLVTKRGARVLSSKLEKVLAAL